ncbi:DUF6143 family protein [Pelosinus sp. sgz500959]|uniref:DUF6143 family protein n=1 Tax=Pelosinus sp. sgz500959 TaxID=3242472 RepID=UPI00366EBBFC
MEKIVNIPISLYESHEGNYFVGQTELLCFGNGKNAWGELFNPCDSRVKLFVNVITVTNISENNFLAELWFNSQLPGAGTISNKVTPTNLTICPEPTPQVKLKFSQKILGVPTCGINAFDRMIPGETTIVEEEDGKFIIPPGGNFAVFLAGRENVALQARVAFGWWEERC